MSPMSILEYNFETPNTWEVCARVISGESKCCEEPYSPVIWD